MDVRCRSVMTDTGPTAAFRGAGRPEATLVMERLIDLAAAELGVDRIASARRNLIPTQQAALPHAAGSPMTAATSPATWTASWRPSTGRASPRASAKSKSAASCAASASPIISRRRSARRTSASRSACADGTVERRRHAVDGQGHETSFAQVMADLSACTPEESRSRRRHGSRVRRRHAFRPLDALGGRDGRGLRPRWWRRPRRRRALLDLAESRHRVRRRPLHRPGTDRSALDLDVARAITAISCSRTSKRAATKATYTGRIPAYPNGCAGARSRSIPTPARSRSALRSSTMPAGNQSDDRRRPGARRHRRKASARR